MSSALTVVYDDRIEPPTDISSVIGAARFSEIIHRRVTLGEIIRRELREGGADDLFHLVDDTDAKSLADLVENSSTDRIFLWLPSCFLPRELGALTHLVRKSRFALRSTILSEPADDCSPAVLLRADALSLLRAKSTLIEREVFANIIASSPRIFDHCRFANLRTQDNFFDFLSGATETRHFNEMSVRGRVYIKSSTNRAKMRAEFDYYHIVPDAMKPYLIPTFDFFDDGVRAGYGMERVSIPDAALQLIHRAFDPASFRNLVQRFASFAAIRKTHVVGSDEVRQVARRAILGKMEDRIAAFLATEIGRRVDGLLERAGPLGSLSDMVVRANRVLQDAIEKDPSAHLAFGHGDPCFSNILFDRRTSLFRLIDPRGSSSLDEGWMHPLYDFAKFSHSILGGYDFINNDLMDCNLDDNLQLELKLDGDGPPEAFKEEFRRMVSETGISLGIVRAYEMSLFMSMLPLHSDHPKKLVSFALVGANLIEMLENQDVR